MFERWRRDYLTDEDYRALQNLLPVNLCAPLSLNQRALAPKERSRSALREKVPAPSPDLIQGLGGSRSAAVSSVNSAALGAGKVTFPVATHSAPRAKVT